MPRLKKINEAQVRCIETGEEFENLDQAARFAETDRNMVYSSAKNHVVCKGWHFVFSHEEDYPTGVPDLEGEIWKDIPGWEGRYQMSNLRRIKALRRQTKNGISSERLMSTKGVVLFRREDGTQEFFNHTKVYKELFVQQKKLFDIE